MDIARTLRSYDGKRVAPFRAVAVAVQGMPGQGVAQLLDLAASEEPELQVGATWVIKYLAERGVVLRGPQGERPVAAPGPEDRARRHAACTADAAVR